MDWSPGLPVYWNAHPRRKNGARLYLAATWYCAILPGDHCRVIRGVHHPSRFQDRGNCCRRSGLKQKDGGQRKGPDRVLPSRPFLPSAMNCRKEEQTIPGIECLNRYPVLAIVQQDVHIRSAENLPDDVWAG